MSVVVSARRVSRRSRRALRHARQRRQACSDCVNLSALPGIHVLLCCATKTWMAGTSPAMTSPGLALYISNAWAIAAPCGAAPPSRSNRMAALAQLVDHLLPRLAADFL